MKKVIFSNDYADIIDVEEYDNYIFLVSIIIKEKYRNLGIGTEIVNSIISYAKSKDKPLLLFVSNELGGDKEKLLKWYKSLGFYEEYNKIDAMYNYNMRF